MRRCPPRSQLDHITALISFVISLLITSHAAQAYSLINANLTTERSGAAGPGAQTVTLNPLIDNTLYQDPEGDLSNGGGSAMFSGRNSSSSNSVRRAVLAFDIAAAIPAGSTIQSAAMTLYNDAANVAPATIEMHRLTQSWSEGASMATGGQGSGAPAAPGDATWLYRFYNTALWTTPGGSFAPSISADIIVEGPGSYAWPSTALLVGDVQHFLDHPSDNFGWLLLGDESAPSTAKRFATREAVDPSQRPSLTIEFLPIPEPPSAALLISALIAPLTLRRSNFFRRITSWRGHCSKPGPIVTKFP